MRSWFNVVNVVNVGCPTVLRVDHGTENGLAATAQIAFRRDGADSLAGDKSAHYGTSPADIVG